MMPARDSNQTENIQVLMTGEGSGGTAAWKQGLGSRKPSL